MPDAVKLFDHSIPAQPLGTADNPLHTESSVGSSDSPMTINSPFVSVGAHSDGLTISSATILTRPAGATKLMMQALGQNVRYTLDGTTPTASKGFQLKAESTLFIEAGTGVVVTVIQEAATADLQFQWGQ